MAHDTLLRAERKARGLSVRAVAAAIDVDPSNLSRIELGSQTPTKTIARKLFAYYGGAVPIADIYDPLFRFEVIRGA